VFELKRQLTLCALLLVVAPILACAGAAEDSEEAAAAEPGSEIVARIGDWSITLDELDDKARAANMKAYQAIYDTRSQVLEQIINERLVQDEAAARGVDQDELFRVEITEKLQPVTDEQIQEFYDQNKGRMGDATLDQMRGQIEAFLTRQQAVVAQQEFVNGLRENVDVKILLDPPRTEIVVAANEISRGPDSAKVTMIYYSDFQ
jgi:hypothetical protein